MLAERNAGFDLATPVGLVIGGGACRGLGGGHAAGPRHVGAEPGALLRVLLLVLVLAWAVVSLAGLPPLADPQFVEQARTALLAVAALATVLYIAAAVRYFLLYRRRRAVMLLSIVTANVLLAEAMIAVALAPNWRLSWWEWHLLFIAAYGYLAYSAYVQYGREGATAGLFDAVGTDDTARAVRAEYGAALETLVTAIRRQEAGELSEAEMTLITAGLASQVGLTEGQTAVLGRAATALRSEREQAGRLNALVAVGKEARVGLAEDELLRQAVLRAGEGFDRDGIRVGLLTDGRLRVPRRAVHRTQLADGVEHGARCAGGARGPRADLGRRRPARSAAHRQGPARRRLAGPSRQSRRQGRRRCGHDRIRRPGSRRARVAGQPVVDRVGERPALPPARRPVPPVHVARTW